MSKHAAAAEPTASAPPATKKTKVEQQSWELLEETKIHYLLRHTSLKHLIELKPACPVATCTPGTTLKEALKTLSEHHIMSMPVMANGSYKGMFEVSSFVGYLLKHAKEAGTDDATQKLPIIERWTKMIDLGKELEQKTVEHVLASVKQVGSFCVSKELEGVYWLGAGLPRPDAALTCDSELEYTSLREVLERFVKPGWKLCHRMVVFKTKQMRDLHAIVSQTDIMRYIAFNIHALDQLADKTLKEAGLSGPGQQVYEVKHDMPTIEAFSVMINNHISALPVVDKDGRVASNISLSDLRGFKPEDFPLLETPVEEFLKSRKKHHFLRRISLDMKAITASEDTTVKEVMLRFMQGNVHRVYIVNKDNVATGVVSNTDMLQLMLKPW